MGTWPIFVDDQETNRCACKNHIAISLDLIGDVSLIFYSTLEPTAVIVTKSRIPIVQFLIVYPLAKKIFRHRIGTQKKNTESSSFEFAPE